MAIIKKTLFKQDLDRVNTLVVDKTPNSVYFKVTESSDTFTGGKNSILIQGSPYLVNGTEIKIEIKDALGETIYFEPAKGDPEPYEGVAKVLSVHIYPDTAFGPCTITILGEISDYIDDNGSTIPVPDIWKDSYNVKWQKTINVNPNLRNTTKIRFYKTPKFNITEQILPIYNRTPNIVTISGSISGKALIPVPSTDFTNFNGRVNYQLNITDNSAFSQSMEGLQISIKDLPQSYTASITDVVTSKLAVVSTPYFETSSANPNVKIVNNFETASFTASFEDGAIVKDSNVNSSFAKIKISNLETFTGDVHRVKVYGKSLNWLGDFELLEDIQLESSDLLVVNEFSESLNVRTGLFTEPIIEAFWTTSSIDTNVSYLVDDSVLTKSVKLMPTVDTNSTKGLFYFSTTQSIEFSQGTEYQLDFTPLLSASSANYGILEIYMTGSAFVDTDINFGYGKQIAKIETPTSFRRFDKQQYNFVADTNGNGELLFLVKSGVWQISDVSLSTAAETSFSPNEISLNVNVPNKINQEKFEFKFEFYDINNNYVPIDFRETFTFAGGNDIVANKNILLTVSNNSFAFNSAGTEAFPEYINFNIQTQAITGSITFHSSAYDDTGSLIPYTESPYPGLLQIIDSNNWRLTSASFSGSLTNYKVSAIEYTASADGVNAYATVYRLNEGKVGKTGAGIVYRGEWSASVNYYGNDKRRDVVLGKRYDIGSLTLEDEYFLCAVDHTSVDGQRPADENTGGVTAGNVWGNLWTTFSVQFDSVATDILFAQDVYANRTINIGSKGGNPVIALDSDYPTNLNPNIRISASFYNDNGIFIGFDSGSPKLSLRGGNNALLWDGGSLVVSGSVRATEGKIAGWVIDRESLRDENNKIILNPITPSIEIYDDSNIKRLDVRYGELTDYNASASDFDINPPDYTILTQSFSSPNSIDFIQYSDSHTPLTIAQGKPLTYYATIGWNPITNFAASFSNFDGYVYFNRGIEIRTDSDILISRIYARETQTSVSYVDGPNQNMKIDAYSESNVKISFPNVGNYKIYSFYSFYGYFFSSDPFASSNFQIFETDIITTGFTMYSENELTELTNEGIQVLKNSNKYFRIVRDDPAPYSDPKVVARIGGKVVHTAELSGDDALVIDRGNIRLNDGNIITTGGGTISFANLSVTNNTTLGPTNPQTNGYSPQLTFTTKEISSVVRPHIYMYNIPFSNQYSGNNRNLLIKSSGANFGLVTADASSSKRYKKNIVEWNKSVLNSLNNVKVSQYNYKDQSDSDKKFIGLIAEDLHENGLAEFVEYNDDGEVEAINKNDFIFLLMKSVQELTEKVKELENKIDNSK